MLEFVFTQRRRSRGGFGVERVRTFARRRVIGPFIFFDDTGPRALPAGLADDANVRSHPHIGLSTVDGEIRPLTSPRPES